MLRSCYRYVDPTLMHMQTTWILLKCTFLLRRSGWGLSSLFLTGSQVMQLQVLWSTLSAARDWTFFQPRISGFKIPSLCTHPSCQASYDLPPSTRHFFHLQYLCLSSSSAWDVLPWVPALQTTAALLTSGIRSFFVVKGCPVYWKMLSSVPGLYLLDASSPLPQL